MKSSMIVVGCVVGVVSVSACDRADDAAPADAATVTEDSTTLATEEPVVAAPEDEPMTVTMAEPLPADVGEDDEAVEVDLPTIGNSEPTIEIGGGMSIDPLTEANIAYDRILADIISPEGLVRYELLRKPTRMQRLEQVVNQYAELDLPKTDAGKLALWINAYNANTLFQAARVSGRADFTSVNDTPGFFDARTITVAGDPMTLNALENEKIRKVGPHADARIHAALVCAAMSCPPLRNESYDADRLDAQLDDQAQRWVNDDSKNRVSDDGIEVSEIFKWYAEDFETPMYDGVVGFIKAHADADSELALRLSSADDVNIEYVPYDWSLNDSPVAVELQK